MDKIINQLAKEFPDVQLSREYDTDTYVFRCRDKCVKLANQKFKRIWEDHESGEKGKFTEAEIKEQKKGFYEASKKLLSRL